MSLATLSIDLEAKLANLEQGMNQAARLTERNTQQMQRSLDSLKLAGSALAGVLSGAFAAFSITQFVRGAVDGIDALNDLKDATGASVENLSALEDVARRGGTSVETMGTALLKFNKVLNEAKPDSDAGRIIKSIGLDAEALKRVDPAEALRQVALALGKYANDGDKARAVQELFGRSTKDVAKFLKDLGEQGKLVATMTTEQAEEAKKFNDQLDALSKNSTDLARRLTRDLVPALSSIAEAYNKGGVKSALDALGEQIGLGAEFHERRAMEQLKNGITDLEREKKRLDKVLAVSPSSPLAAGLEEVNSKIANSNAQLEGLRVKYLRLTDGAAGGGRGFVNPAFTPGLPGLKVPEKGDGAGKDKKEQISEASRALAQYVEQLERELEKNQDLTESQKGLNLLKRLGTVGEIPQVRELVLNLAKQVETTNDLKEEEAKYTAELKRQSDVRRDLDNQIDALSGRTLDKKKAELTSRLEEQLNAGVIFSPEELDRIVNGIAGISTQVKETASDLEKFAASAQASIEQTLGDNIFDALSGNFDNIEKSWANMLKRMAAQAISAQIGKTLFGDEKTGSAGAITTLFQFLKNANGNAFGPGGVQAFAQGGIFGSPTMFAYGGSNLGIMGEAGPEAVMPLKRGADGKLGVASSGGGPSIVINNGDTIVGPGVSRGEVAAAVRQGQAQTEARIRRLLRNGNI